MRIIEKMQDNIAILLLQGKLIGPPETDDLYKQVKSLLSRDINNIIIDFRSLSWMGSMGIGTIMRSLITVRNVGGDLRLSALTDKLESLFSITQIIGIIKTYKSINLAVNSFKTK